MREMIVEWCSFAMGGMACDIDAEFDGDRIVARLDVNVAGPPLQRGKDRGIDQANDGADVALRRQLIDRNCLFAGRFVFADYIQRKSFAGLFQHALRLLGLFENVTDLLERRNFGDNPLAQQKADFIDHHQLAGIGDGDG